jgi:hypothetical protein
MEFFYLFLFSHTKRRAENRFYSRVHSTFLMPKRKGKLRDWRTSRPSTEKETDLLHNRFSEHQMRIERVKQDIQCTYNVYSFVFVILVIQHAKRMRRIVLSSVGLSGFTISFDIS